MAEASAPPPKGKGTPPTNGQPDLGGKTDDYVGLNFRVPAEFAWEFKACALQARRKQNAFVQDLLAFWKATKEEK